jgi:4-hydroxy-4-methyl-2-oxoglutarate aldolase
VQDAVAAAQPGNVLVVDHGSRADPNRLRSVAALPVARAGIVGGRARRTVRDADDLRAQVLPIYTRGAVPTAVQGRTGSAAFVRRFAALAWPSSRAAFLVASGGVFMPEAFVEQAIEIGNRLQATESELRRRLVLGEG